MADTKAHETYFPTPTAVVKELNRSKVHSQSVWNPAPTRQASTTD